MSAQQQLDLPPPYSEATKKPQVAHIPNTNTTSLKNNTRRFSNKANSPTDVLSSNEKSRSAELNQVEHFQSIIKEVKDKFDEQASSYQSVSSKISELTQIISNLNISEDCKRKATPSLSPQTKNHEFSFSCSKSHSPSSKINPDLKKPASESKKNKAANLSSPTNPLRKSQSSSKLTCKNSATFKKYTNENLSDISNTNSNVDSNNDNDDWYDKISGILEGLVENVETALITSQDEINDKPEIETEAEAEAEAEAEHEHENDGNTLKDTTETSTTSAKISKMAQIDSNHHRPSLSRGRPSSEFLCTSPTNYNLSVTSNKPPLRKFISAYNRVIPAHYYAEEKGNPNEGDYEDNFDSDFDFDLNLDTYSDVDLGPQKRKNQSTNKSLSAGKNKRSTKTSPNSLAHKPPSLLFANLDCPSPKSAPFDPVYPISYTHHNSAATSSLKLVHLTTSSSSPKTNITELITQSDYELDPKISHHYTLKKTRRSTAFITTTSSLNISPRKKAYEYNNTRTGYHLISNLDSDSIAEYGNGDGESSSEDLSECLSTLRERWNPFNGVIFVYYGLLFMFGILLYNHFICEMASKKVIKKLQPNSNSNSNSSTSTSNSSAKKKRNKLLTQNPNQNQYQENSSGSSTISDNDE